MIRKLLLSLLFVLLAYFKLSAQQTDTIKTPAEVIYTKGKVAKHTIDTGSLVEEKSKNAPGNKSTKKTSISTLSTTEAISTTSTPQTDAGRIFGNIDVSQTGSATYTLPISVPPGIGGVTPQVVMQYNSQAGNGIAGMGWNISGISLISRIPATQFHDNFTGGINFDSKDRFALDGQRLLLKSGTYGGDGAEYQTEQYSNIKIISKGVSPYGAAYGPASFEVYYPDGSKAFFGHSANSRTPTEFALTYAENPVGLRITYTYQQSNNTLIISKIEYGSKGGSVAINGIDFVYKTADRSEQAFIGGLSFFRNKLLSEISVYGNGTNYRNYVLSYEAVSPLKYQRLIKLEEFNGDKTKSLEPIYFNYNSSANSISSHSISNLSLSSVTGQNSKVLTSDFTGDGTMDFIVYPNAKNKVWLFWDPEVNSGYTQLGYEINTGYFREILPVNWLTHNNKITAGQGFVLIKQPDSKTIKFEVMSAGTVSPVYYQYEKVWDNVPTADGFSDCTGEDMPGAEIPRQFLTGDFNGDGLSDIMAVAKPFTIYNEVYSYDNCEDPSGYCCITEGSYITHTPVHYINLDRRLTSNFVSYAGYLTKSFGANDKLYTADFNGDGRTDILQVSNGAMYVYAFLESYGMNRLTSLSQTIDSRITLTHPPMLGDYNGDGKIDVIFPTGDGSNFFATFTATGKGFIKNEGTYSFTYWAPLWDGYKYRINTLVPNDINGDGKTDMIRCYTETYNDNNQGVLTIITYPNVGVSSQSIPSFEYGELTTRNTNLIHYPTPIFLNADKPNYKLEFGVISDNSVSLFRLHKDQKIDSQLSSVNHSGVSYNVNYQFLDPELDDYDLQVYQSNYKQTFPYIDIYKAPGLSVVNKITRAYKNSSLQQLFAYRNAVSRAQGVGFIGFGQVIRSNWHTDESDPNRMFNINVHNPQLRGAMVQNFTSKSAYLNPAKQDVTPNPVFLKLDAPSYSEYTATATQSVTLSPGFEVNGEDGLFEAKIINTNESINDGATLNDYITRTDYQYKTETLGNKVFINVAESVISKNLLSGTTSTKTFEYDPYYNTTREFNDFSGAGTQNTEITYSNSTGSDYHIGRPLIKKVSLNNGSDTFSSEERYAYTGYLPTELKKKGHNTAFITENLQHDLYGNIIQKTVVTPNSGQRSTSMVYDASGRFMTSITDADGMTTQYTYNTSTGNILTKTNPYSQINTYEYDTWGRQIQMTDYLGINYYKSFSKSGSDVIINENDDEGRASSSTINALGKLIYTGEKNLQGQWSYKSFVYDVYGRLEKESEPYAGSPNQWNQTKYDEYGRVEQNTCYTGKITNISYNGLSTTVNDGTKSITTTKNAIGQTTSVQDPGGVINYTYFANGNLKASNFEGSEQSIEQDGWGRKIKLTDPSAGVYEYRYNDFGELTGETTPKGNTTYSYDGAGKLTGKTSQGDNTDMSWQYTYNNTTKLLSNLVLSNADGNNTSYTYTYDNNKRLSSQVEDNVYARFSKTLTYDGFGRLASETSEARNKLNNKIASKAVAHTYLNGELSEITDQVTGASIWKINTVNARGQLTSSQKGVNIRQTNVYDTYGFPQSMISERIAGTSSTLMNIGYNFDPVRGNLNSRSNSVFSSSESFTFDNQDRLTNFNDNNGNNSHLYDNRGRISNNSQLGDYTYNGASYRQTELNNITPDAVSWYQARTNQQISYNAFKSPVEITEQGKEKISFQYNGAMGRAHMYYGDESADKMQRRLRRHYSEDGSMEITNDLQTGTTNFVFYLGGDAYNAPAIWKEVHTATQTTQALYYLHRDHLGSIVMISDDQGVIKEKRQFDAWGNIVKLTDGEDNILTAFVILDRGYTGHEHLLGVGLIHMNGRLYDPKLHRFLSPDNYVQDPFNTQNFNRYGYVLNNPLKYTDESGEIFGLIIAAAAIFGVGNVAVQAANGEINNFWDGAKAFGAGALTGALISTGVTAGLGVPILGSAIKVAGSIYAGTTAISVVGGTVQGVITGDWSGLANAGKALAGMFYLDGNRSFFGQVLQGVSRYSWELPQSTLGFGYTQVRNAFGGVDRIDYFGGATFATNENTDGRQGISIGNYINISISDEIEGRFSDRVVSDPLFMHEYGHTFDSQIFGLSYLFGVGIPSAAGAEWTERRANRHASKYFDDHFGVNWTLFIRRGYPLRR